MDRVLPTARHLCNVSSELCCPDAKPLRWISPLVIGFGVIAISALLVIFEEYLFIAEPSSQTAALHMEMRGYGMNQYSSGYGMDSYSAGYSTDPHSTVVPMVEAYDYAEVDGFFGGQPRFSLHNQFYG